ncbi:hypothetical protein DAPPUDRAFT_51878 [Daphnia pulex]|uniref:C3H1-type domain-containing protein n=1 Tax=Daphnia pulex TaxID=6669 RepID=E9GL63_DAPPU|nr:hypothetical protein DAPPUDRAFT_51878 [Daphnia pulex]|eukprot:EFX79798.1 hypothetical protein DAPPUDRAFT_51878 [Daphnia pulex]
MVHGDWPTLIIDPSPLCLSPFRLDHVEITDMRVTVCRDAVSGKCLRNSCKFYHLPIVLPHPATLASSLAR